MCFDYFLAAGKIYPRLTDRKIVEELIYMSSMVPLQVPQKIKQREFHHYNTQYTITSHCTVDAQMYRCIET